jgi:hypothetical protein
MAYLPAVGIDARFDLRSGCTFDLRAARALRKRSTYVDRHAPWNRPRTSSDLVSPRASNPMKRVAERKSMHRAGPIFDTLTFAAVREDLDFHSLQVFEAGFTQVKEWPPANAERELLYAAIAGAWPLIARHDVVQASRWLSPCACRKGKKFTRRKGRCLPC